MKDTDGATVRSFPARAAAGAGNVAWDGTTMTARSSRTACTRSGSPARSCRNVGEGRDQAVAVYRSLSWVASSKTVFFPQDLDGYGKTTKFSFTLSADATVTLVVKNEAGEIVATNMTRRRSRRAPTQSPGTGKADGTMAPRGRYSAWVSATDGTLTATASGRGADARSGQRHDPGRGQAITVYATSAEALDAPGSPCGNLARRPERDDDEDRHLPYRVTLTLKTGGSAGTVRLLVSGVDRAGGTNWATMALLPTDPGPRRHRPRVAPIARHRT